ncbi:MAG: hypothetical protein IPQ13_12855 [Holophagaceae bacterium]|nr:hypothetical protein [Holophagaceae bacterium]
MNTRSAASMAILAVLALTGISCEKKLSQEAIAAQEATKAADDRVARLEQQLADLKAGKHAPKEADQGTLDSVAKGEQKAIERQLQSAKKKAEAKKREAEQLAAAPAPKAEAPKTIVLEVPIGTTVEVKLDQDLGTDKQQAGDAWSGTLASDVVVGGSAAWKAGTPVHGVVTQSAPLGRLASGKGGLAIRLTEVGSNDVDSDTHLVVGDKRGERNAKIIGGGAALGALIGILSDKKNKNDHALGGAAIGAAAGTAAAAATADTVVRMKAATPVVFTLSTAEKVTVKK